MFTLTLRLRWSVWGCALAVSLLGMVAFRTADRLAVPHLSIAGLPFAQKDASALAEHIRSMVDRPVVIRWQGVERTALPSELGVSVSADQAIEQAVALYERSSWVRIMLWVSGRLESVDLPVEVTVDSDHLSRALEQRFGVMGTPPTDARLLYGEPVGEVVAGEWGQELDLDVFIKQLKRVVFHEPIERVVDVPIRAVRPRVAAEDLSAWEELFTLGVATTTFDPSQVGRAQNIRLAASRMDGVILLPGDEFSMNGATGERTADDGYQEAPVIIDGELVPGIGGGVSQVASTTFNAALLAGMRMTEYHNHSLPVPYLPLGRDATVWYDQLDLRFVNTSSQPIVVNAAAGHDWVRVMLRSPQPVSQHVVVETRVIEEYPVPVEERDDPALPHGERRLEQAGRSGHRVQIRQVIFEADRPVDERKLEARYQPQPEVWVVGTGS